MRKIIIRLERGESRSDREREGGTEKQKKNWKGTKVHNYTINTFT